MQIKEKNSINIILKNLTIECLYSNKDNYTDCQDINQTNILINDSNYIKKIYLLTDSEIQNETNYYIKKIQNDSNIIKNPVYF